MHTLRLLTLLLLVPGRTDAEETVTLWPRADGCYLVVNTSTPVWPRLPASAAIAQPLVLRIRMPLEFRITAYEDTQGAGAANPPQLITPRSLRRTQADGWAEYTAELPAVTDRRPASLSLLVNPGQSRPGVYALQLALSTADATRQWPVMNAKAVVRPEMAGRQPQRLRVQLYSYEGQQNPAYGDEIVATLGKAGINAICDMSFSAAPDRLSRRAARHGIKSLWLWFWHKEKSAVLAVLPEARRLGADGRPEEELCYAWCIEHREEVKRALVDYIRSRVAAGGYAGIINDNEERAFDSERGEIAGDVHTPATLEQFRRQARLAADATLTTRTIAANHREAWIEFRCWQSAQMSAILAESVAAVNAALDYGYYSGYKGVGGLAERTRSRYATDWDLLGGIGRIRFGTAGYSGGVRDLVETARALAPRPFVPAEMYVEHFSKNRVPSPENFEYRLLCALLYGTGGVGVWYQQVLDGAAYAAIAKVTAVATEIEDILLDGDRRGQELAEIGGVEADAVMAYAHAGRRLLVAFNHGAQPRTLTLRWRSGPGAGDTRELVSGRNFGRVPDLTMTLAPKSCALFVSVAGGD